MKIFFLIVSIACAMHFVSAQAIPKGQFVEAEQPFLRSALIVSENPVNRVRRGILLPLGDGYWTCFDPDLLRHAALWKAPAGQAPLSMDSMAGVSYPDEKAKADKPPMLRGEVISQTTELPGVGIGALPGKDVREAELLGGKGKVGPLPVGAGRYLGLLRSKHGVIVTYRVGTRYVREINRVIGGKTIERVIAVGAGRDSIAIGLSAATGKISPRGNGFSVEFSDGSMPFLEVRSASAVALQSAADIGTALQISGGAKEQVFRIIRSAEVSPVLPKLGAFPRNEAGSPPFPEKIKMSSPPAKIDGSPIVERPLNFPSENPWKRVVRPTDLAFLSNGDALITTLDGDVWRVENIGAETATWSRAACGIFEPMSIAIGKDDTVFVLGRDQITRLDDIDGDGFFDIYACASDAFLQTLHTRDYATSLEIEDDGSFLIGRSGLVGMGAGKYDELTVDRGSVLRISPNGLIVKSLADGLRLPFIGRRGDGAIFASDQQGNYIPSTPIHQIGDDKPYLGYDPADFRAAKQPIPPLVWFPYQVNRSGASFAMLSAKGFPSLGDTFAHLSWSGRIFLIVTPSGAVPFAWRLPHDFAFPMLGAACHPENGKLYATGIGISGYLPTTPKQVGLAEISEKSPMVAPVSITVESQAVTVNFKNPLPASLSVITLRPELDLWNIKRTKEYGSGHFRWDGAPGEHSVTPISFDLSADRTKLSMEVPAIFKSDILRLRLQIHDSAVAGEPYPLEIYVRADFLPVAGNAELAAVVEREKVTETPEVPADAELGKTLFTNYGCTGCHALDGAELTGPPLNGIASRHGEDLDAYLKTSILEPAAFIAEGYEASMPSYAGVIPDQEIAHIIAFIRGLK